MIVFCIQSITIVDTPGILSGEKQRTSRGYDFTGVLKWFADRADRILLLFDAHKLDISDEFKLSIEALKGNDDKIRIVLNKVNYQSLNKNELFLNMKNKRYPIDGSFFSILVRYGGCSIANAGLRRFNVVIRKGT